MSNPETRCRVSEDTRSYYANLNKPGDKQMTDSEIREKVLESSDFTYYVADSIVDGVTNQQWSIISNYILSNAPHHRRQADREADIGRYVLETLHPIVAKTLAYCVERYKDKNDITYGLDDE